MKRDAVHYTVDSDAPGAASHDATLEQQLQDITGYLRSVASITRVNQPTVLNSLMTLAFIHLIITNHILEETTPTVNSDLRVGRTKSKRR